MMSSIAQLLLILLMGAVVFAPAVLVYLSDRSEGGAKFGWIIVALWFSWLGFAVFLIVTKPPPRRKRNTPLFPDK